MNYLKQIVRYYFYNDIPSKELIDKVQQRLVSSQNTKECDSAIKEIWDETVTGGAEDTSWEEAFRKTELKLHGDGAQSMGARKIIPLRWMRIAAMWLIPFLMLVTSGYLYFVGPEECSQGLSTISYSQLNVTKGEKAEYVLPDGSKVWLNAGSTLIYPSTFLCDVRDVYLIGEGYFEVKKDSLHPFVVNTNYMNLKVLGTSFNVSAYPDDSQVEATLESGSLKVHLLDNSISYLLEPNEQLTYNPSTKLVVKNKVVASNYSDWRKGGLFFNSAPFEEVMRELDRTLNVKIHLRTSAYREQKVYVHFNRDESVEHIFQILKLMIPELEYKITDKDVYIE